MRVTTMRVGVFAATVAAVLVLAAAGIASADEGLEIAGAWVRHAPPSAQQHAGYFIDDNR